MPYYVIELKYMRRKTHPVLDFSSKLSSYWKKNQLDNFFIDSGFEEFRCSCDMYDRWMFAIDVDL